MCFAHCAHDTYEVKVRVWRSQQRLECANLLALLLAARADPQRVGLRSRKTAATSRRTLQTLARLRNSRVCADARSVQRAKQVPHRMGEGEESSSVGRRIQPHWKLRE